MIEQEQRERVVMVARSFIGTPDQDCAAVKGAGVDCATFLALVYAEAGLIPQLKLPAYSPQWFLHHSEQLYLGIVSTHAHEITRPPSMGDVVLFKLKDYQGRPLGRCYSHGAIVIAWPDAIVHAH